MSIHSMRYESRTAELPLCINYINQGALNLGLHQEILLVHFEVQVECGPSEIETA
jgi:hypothetical protein